MFQRLSKGETLYNSPARLRHKNGSLQHVLIASSVLFDDAGHFVQGLLVKRGHLTRPSFEVSRTLGASRPESLPMAEGARCPQAQSLALGMYQ